MQKCCSSWYYNYLGKKKTRYKRDISNGNWTEWVQVGLESYARFQNRTSAQYDFTLKLRDTSFNCHFITSILKSQNSVAQIQPSHTFYWSNTKLTCKIWKTCLWFSCYLIGHFEQALKSDWLSCLSKAFSLAGKNVQFNETNGAIRE